MKPWQQPLTALRRSWTWLSGLGLPAFYLLFFLFDLWLATRPLLREFHYEWALSQSLLLAATCGALAVAAPASIAVSLRRWLLLLALSLDAIVLAQGVHGFCRLSRGLFLYAAFVPFSALCGLAVGRVAAAATAVRWRQGLLFLAAFAILLLYPLLQIRFSASIFTYSILFGYWPGSLYDESLHLPLAFGWHRLFALWFAVNGLALSAWLSGPARRQVRPRNGLLLLSLALNALPLFFQPALQWSRQAAQIERHLGGTYKSENLIISYPREREGDPLIQGAIREARFYEQRLRQRLQRVPSQPLRIYLYRSREERGAWIGAFDTTLGNPWTRTIHFVPEEYPLPLLGHEMAHLFAADVGPWPLRLPRHVAIAEGLAEALAPARGPFTLHQVAAAILAHREIGLESFFRGLGFYRQSPLAAYPLAGSFVSYLLERHGLAPFWQLYHGGDFRAAYRQELPQLLAAWRQVLAGQRLPADEEKELDERWKKGPIFERRCPRCTAEWLESGAEAQRLGRPAEAEAAYRQAQAIAGGDPAPRLALISALLSEGRVEEAAQESLLGRPEDPEKIQRALARIRFAAAASPENRSPLLARWMDFLKQESDPWNRLALTVSLRLLVRGAIADFKIMELLPWGQSKVGVLRRQLAEGIADPAFTLDLARLLQRLGREAEAAEVLQAAPLPPGDSPWYFPSLILRAQALSLTGRNREGLLLLQAARPDPLRPGEAAQLADWRERLSLAADGDLPANGVH